MLAWIWRSVAWREETTNATVATAAWTTSADHSATAPMSSRARI
jgi:hypothetical protein